MFLSRLLLGSRPAQSSPALAIDAQPAPVNVDHIPVADAQEIVRQPRLHAPDLPVQYRLRTDVVVSVLFYRDLGLALRQIVLHGDKRHLAKGGVHNLPNASLHDQSNQDVMNAAIEEARAWLSQACSPPDAQRAPVATRQPAPSLPSTAAPAPAASSPKQTTAATEKVMVFEGVISSMGLRNWEGADGKSRGNRPSFCVIFADGKKAYGSDLSRAVNDADAMAGDTVKLMKTPFRAEGVGRPGRLKNHWDCEVLARGDSYVAAAASDARRAQVDREIAQLS